MEGIKHRTIQINGIKMHVAEKGHGPAVLFLHGFPELWYSWRHQIQALASLGYRAIAPDLRGYGDTEAPDSIASYTCFHMVGDIVALLDFLGEDQVYLVAHDMGAMVAWYLCLFRPDLVKAFVSLSVPYRPRNPKFKPIATLRAVFGDDYYMCRFQEPGEIEAEIAKCGTEQVLKKIFSERSSGPPLIPKENPFGISPDAPITLPSWLSEDDLNYYAKKYEEKGFTGGLNEYRTLDLNWELMAPWTGGQVKVPVKYIVGDMDMVYHMPGVKDYVHNTNGGFKRDVPFLQEVEVIAGVGHFINQERAEDISYHIYEFIRKF
ncbi:hypothetical protein Nepgr_009575 [Nepenthes gracilis]|uniref:soluble epoxide hydrolase n=1 Tax=Nepenthes gracilis TaxID=150966 RepID=A0AAD3SBF0_NEPGR|nr:hypothetical protein Nepgr_009575 [Nepenthes gracilis]